MSINCNLLFSYSNKRDYIGNLNFRNIVSMEVQRVFDATASDPPTASNVPPLVTGAYTGVIVNGVDFGTGRVLSFSNPVSYEITENGRTLWKQNVAIEVYTLGDLSNINSSQALNGVVSAYSKQLSSLDESFNFDISSDGDYQYNHSASVTCTDEPFAGGESGYIIAQRIASGLINSAPDFGYIDALHQGLYTSVGNRTYSESVDIYGGTVSFDEKFVIQNRDFVKHDVAFDNGYINITENGSIRHSGVSTAQDVFTNNPLSIYTKFETLSGSAYARCNSLWDTYAAVLGTDVYESDLHLQPMSINKSFDERSQEFTYSLTFTNNPNMSNGYTIDREQSISCSLGGIIEASENGSMQSYAFKSSASKDTLLTAISSEMSNASGRLSGLLNNFSSMKKFSESKGYSSIGKNASYSVGYTNDPSFINDGTYLTKTTSVNDNLPIKMHNSYFILGRSTPLVHNPGQTQFGTVTCSIIATIPRPTNYSPNTPVKPTATLNSMFLDAINTSLIKVGTKTPLDTYVSKVSYTYSSDMNVELTTETQYVYAKENNI